MLSSATLYDLMGILSVQADQLEAAAAGAVDLHNAEYARAKLARAKRLRGYHAEIELHLTAQAMAAEYTTNCLSQPTAPSDEARFN
jgi:hypothetical protein